jgi:hypothetical protein
MTAKCFISYCHDGADFEAIEALHQQIQVLCGELFEVVRDKSHVKTGSSISQHEELIDESDIIVVLFSPQYKTRIVNRTPGGVYREYGRIIDKYNTYVDRLKHGRKPRPFLFVPLLFAGTKETSIPDEISDPLFEIFTDYRVIKDRSGTYVVRDHVQKLFADKFEKLGAQFRSIHAGIQRSFSDEYNQLLDLLFVQDKHEILRKKYHFKNADEMLNRLFVKTKSFLRISDRDKCILIGRKGSGKSTIVDHFHRDNTLDYKPPIKVSVDEFDMQYLYNFTFSGPHSGDIGDLLPLENYFEACWKLFIIQQCCYTLMNEAAAGRNAVAVALEMPALISHFAKNKKKTKFAQFVDVCAKVRQSVDLSIQVAGTGPDFFAEVADRSSVDAIIQSIIPEAVLAAYSSSMKQCLRRFIFALDGFDQRFEDFRNRTRNSGLDEKECSLRLRFEVAWLKGLLRAVLDFRSSDEVVQDKVDFCITIPQDRYLEVRQAERDDYRLRSLAAYLQWSAFELAILLRKRLEALTDTLAARKLGPLERLDQVFASDQLDLPTSIEMRVGKNVITVNLFSYLLRHTFWRPRDMMFYLAAILATRKYAVKQNKHIDPALIREIVSRTTFDVINTEFIKEYQNTILNIREIIQLFEGAKIIMDYAEFEKRVRTFAFTSNEGLLRVDDEIKKLDLLYDIGFLGIELDSVQRRTVGGSREMFVFSHGQIRYGAISKEKKRSSRIVINPIFVEFLLLDTDVDRIVCLYSDEFLKHNDLLND